MSTIETSLCQRCEDLTREKGRAMSVMVTTRLDGLPGAGQDAVPAAPGRRAFVGAVLLDRMAAIAEPTWAADHERVWTAAPEQRVLAVEFRSAGGERWHGVGGGATVAEAIRDARESLPEDASWEPVGWNDLYGD
jgi:hypothetical protein